MDDGRPPRTSPCGAGSRLRGDVRGDPSWSLPHVADVLHRTGEHGAGVGGPRGLPRDRPRRARPASPQRPDRDRSRSRALSAPAHGRRSHGYFREEFGPHCGEEGKFLLNDEEVEILGRTMAGVLRHFPERYGLEMDTHGWVDLRDFLTAVQIRNRRFRFLRQHHVVGLIETDPKGRYQFDDGNIRATYGHSKH